MASVAVQPAPQHNSSVHRATPQNPEHLPRAACGSPSTLAYTIGTIAALPGATGHELPRQQVLSGLGQCSWAFVEGQFEFHVSFTLSWVFALGIFLMLIGAMVSWRWSGHFRERLVCRLAASQPTAVQSNLDTLSFEEFEVRDVGFMCNEHFKWHYSKPVYYSKTQGFHAGDTVEPGAKHIRTRIRSRVSSH